MQRWFCSILPNKLSGNCPTCGLEYTEYRFWLSPIFGILCCNGSCKWIRDLPIYEKETIPSVIPHTCSSLWICNKLLDFVRNKNPGKARSKRTLGTLFGHLGLLQIYGELSNTYVGVFS